MAISNSRGPDSLTELVSDLGPNARASTVEEAATFGEIILEPIPFGAYEELSAGALADRVVISSPNHFPNRDGKIEFDGRAETELVAAHLADSRVVKAFNAMYWETLRDEARPEAAMEDRLALYLAGDDTNANTGGCNKLK